MTTQHIREFFTSLTLRNRILFTGARRRSAAVKVRGDQMAAEVGGYCLRTKYLLEPAVRSSPALIWIAEHKPEILERYRTVTPQILDVVNPNSKHVHLPLEERYQGFRFLLLNTESTLNYLGTAPETGWRSWVVPHHHCNTTGYLLPDERIETPVTVGYVGEPEHLHDTEEIRDVVSKLGLVWINANSQQLMLTRPSISGLRGLGGSKPEMRREATSSWQILPGTGFLASFAITKATGG
jgi:hypothetical protein